MKHLKFGLISLVVFAVAIGVLSACSSDDDQDSRQSQDQSQDQSEQDGREQRGDQDDQQQQDQEQESVSAADSEQSSETADDEPSQEQVQDQSEQERTTESAGTSTTSSGTDSQDKDTDSAPAEDKNADADTKDSADDSEAQEKQPVEQEQEQGQSETSDDAQDSEPQAEQSEPSEETQESQEAEPTDQAEQTEEQQPREPTEAERLQMRADEIRADATVTDLVGLNGWLNGAETSIALEIAKGNVVLIDFWTYTCINCVRTLPFLTEWDRKYRDHGLVIIGVHTPEFEFEERIENVEVAIAEHGIEYLVAIDNDYRTWRAFENRWWPRKFLIGPTDDGTAMGVRYDHIGEGHYEESEHAIRNALEAVGKDLSDIPFGVDVPAPRRQTGVPRQTRELYAGWSRNNGSGGPYAGQDAYFLAGTDVDTLYHDVDLQDREHHFFYLEGLWRTDRQSIIHARETDDLEDYMALLVRGRTANVVLTVAENGSPFNVYVELDGRWLFPNEAGAHVQWDDEGRSFIRVTENDLYRLLNLPDWSEHELKLRSNSDQFRIWAFTFGSYIGGE